MLSTPIDATTGTEWDTLEMRLQDEEWIAREFAAIMTAAGMARHTLAALAHRPPARRGGSANELAIRRTAPGERQRLRVLQRVRSPPR